MYYCAAATQSRRLVSATAALYGCGFCRTHRHILAGGGCGLRLLRGLRRQGIGGDPDCASGGAQAANQQSESDIHRGKLCLVLHSANVIWRASRYVLSCARLWLSAELKELKAGSDIANAGKNGTPGKCAAPRRAGPALASIREPPLGEPGEQGAPQPGSTVSRLGQGAGEPGLRGMVRGASRRLCPAENHGWLDCRESRALRLCMPRELSAEMQEPRCGKCFAGMVSSVQ